MLELTAAEWGLLKWMAVTVGVALSTTAATLALINHDLENRIPGARENLKSWLWSTWYQISESPLKDTISVMLGKIWLFPRATLLKVVPSYCVGVFFIYIVLLFLLREKVHDLPIVIIYGSIGVLFFLTKIDRDTKLFVHLFIVLSLFIPMKLFRFAGGNAYLALSILNYTFLCGFFRNVKTADDEFKEEFDNSIWISLSLILTFLAFYFGSLVEGEYQIPTITFIMSNILFDTISIHYSLKILKWVSVGSIIKRLPIALVTDIVVGSVCSIFSLVFAKGFRITLTQSFNVFRGFHIDGAGVFLGLDFWAMHTSLIPTLLVLLVLFLAYTAKLLIFPIEWFLGFFGKDKDPLKKTSLLLLVFVSPMGLIALFFSAMEKEAG